VKRLAPGWVDRVEKGIVLVGSLVWPGDDYLIVVWQTSDGGWQLTHCGDDVSYRRTLTGAINDALRRLDLDPNDPTIAPAGDGQWWRRKAA
jgi:hypothetical protein